MIEGSNTYMQYYDSNIYNFTVRECQDMTTSLINNYKPDLLLIGQQLLQACGTQCYLLLLLLLNRYFLMASHHERERNIW